MAELNIQYPIAGPEVTSGAPAFAAFAIEQQMKRDYVFQYTSTTPILACIKDAGLNWNKGFKVQGTRALFGVAHEDPYSGTSLGVLDANEVPAAWPTYVATGGAGQAFVEFTHYRLPFTISFMEDLIANGGARGNLLSLKVKQLMYKFRNTAATDIATAAADGDRDSMCGLPFMAGTTTTLHGVSGTTHSSWRAEVATGTGLWSLSKINDKFDKIKKWSNEEGDGEQPDLLLLGMDDTVNVYGRTRELIAPAERIVNANFKAKYGFENFEYLGMKCVMDHRIASGSAYMLTTKDLFWGGMETPKSMTPVRILGSDAMEYIYSQVSFWGCFQRRRMAKWTGITG